MSNNYDIRRNLPAPSSQDIAKYKNFDALLEQYQAATPTTPVIALKPRGVMVRRLTYIAAAAAALAGIFFVFNWLQKPTTPFLTEAEYFEQQPFVNPPLPEIPAKAIAQTVNAQQGGTYKMPTGSRLVVPTEAFMNDRGELITGDVNMYYREMDDYVDFFLAGIPMNYDSAGTKFNLEASGMIEIYAEQNGERVQLAPGKAIEVELISEIYLPEGSELPHYSVYQLDTASRNWTYEGVAEVRILNEVETSINNNPISALRREYANTVAAIQSAAEARLREIEASVPRPTEPVKPQQQLDNGVTVDLSIRENSVIVEDDPNTPENENERLKQLYGDAIWQIVPGTAYDEQRLSKTTWETFRLRQLNSQHYELTLAKGNVNEKITVMPVLTGKDYNRALREYEQQYAQWQQQMAARDAQLKSQKDEVQQNLIAEKATAKKTFEKALAAKGENVEEALMSKKRVASRFQATSLGVWNCSHVLTPASDQLQGKLQDQTGEAYRQQPVYLVNKYQNTIYRFYAAEDALIRFNEGSENLLWIVNEQKQIAVLRPEDFKKAAEKDRRKIVLQRLNEPIRGAADVREILSFNE
ncbi:MAG: hypothetical protein ACK4TA_09610 [Saprospiraceae bacterium]